MKETEQPGTLTPQKEFVDPNLVRPQHFERPKMRSGCKVKTSSSEQYSGGTPSTGLVASFDFELYAMVESTLAVPLSTTVAGTELPVTSLHQTLDECLRTSERAIQRKMAHAVVELPAHLGDGVFKFRVTAAHTNCNNPLQARPTPVPRTHLPGTPDYLESESRLHTTYGALTTQEHTSRIVLNDLSLLLHLVDQQQRLIDTLEAHTNMSDEVSDVISNSRHLTTKAKRRVSESASRMAMMAQFNRRWSMVDGAARDERRVVLGKPYLGDISVLGDPSSAQGTPKHEASSRSSTSSRKTTKSRGSKASGDAASQGK